MPQECAEWHAAEGLQPRRSQGSGSNCAEKTAPCGVPRARLCPQNIARSSRVCCRVCACTGAHKTRREADPRHRRAPQTRPLPERFEDSSKFRHKAAKQHPLYGTSNSSYGARPPMQSEMPQIWNGVRVRTAAPLGFAALLLFSRARRAQRRLHSRRRATLGSQR